jgi:hypothetical protein
MLAFAISGIFSESIQNDLKTAFSVLSLGVTAYFWFVRANRERLSVGIHQVGGFEGVLEAGQVGVWTGRVSSPIARFFRPPSSMGSRR